MLRKIVKEIIKSIFPQATNSVGVGIGMSIIFNTFVIEQEEPYDGGLSSAVL